MSKHDHFVGGPLTVAEPVPRGTSTSFGADVGRDTRGRFIRIPPVEDQAKISLDTRVAHAKADMGVSTPNKCPICLSGNTKVGWHKGRITHRIERKGLSGKRYQPCLNWDTEGRHIAEPLGFYVFAWWPTRCRNGKLRWLVSVERHEDGTFTLGDRAH